MRTILGRHCNIYELNDETSLFVKPLPTSKRIQKIKRWNRKARKAGKCRWVEKTPNHIFHIAEILELLPDALIIVMLRDGRDVACSLRNRGVVWGDYTNDFAGATQKWMDAVHAALDFREKVYRVRYEDLVENPESVVRELMTYLDEPFELDVLEGRDTLRKGDSQGESNIEYRSWQASQAIFDGRGIWRQEMSNADKQLFKEAAGDLLLQLGYPESMN
jgi:hypothetical protein